MKAKTIFKLFIIKVNVALIFILCWLIGGGGGGSDNANAQDKIDGGTKYISRTGNGSNALVCENMLSKDFASAHSLSIDTYNITENPTEGAEEVATLCTIKKEGKRIMHVSVANANRKTFNSLLAQLQSVHKMVEDHLVGARSAYAEDHSLFVFLSSNNATSVSITNYVKRNLEETKVIAQEIHSNLPDVKPLADTTPELLCPDMVSPLELSTIFGRKIIYKSNTPTAISNILTCEFCTEDDASLKEMVNGNIDIYCDPPPNQLTPQQSFNVSKRAALNGGAKAPGGNDIKFENVQSLPGIGSEAYYYRTVVKLPVKVLKRTTMETDWVIILHERKNCSITMNAGGYSGPDLNQPLSLMAKKVYANIAQ